MSEKKLTFRLKYADDRPVGVFQSRSNSVIDLSGNSTSRPTIAPEPVLSNELALNWNIPPGTFFFGKLPGMAFGGMKLFRTPFFPPAFLAVLKTQSFSDFGPLNVTCSLPPLAGMIAFMAVRLNSSRPAYQLLITTLSASTISILPVSSLPLLSRMRDCGVLAGACPLNVTRSIPAGSICSAGLMPAASQIRPVLGSNSTNLPLMISPLSI